MPQRRCVATTKAGERCRASALPDDEMCFTHSPAVADQREERNRRGGRNKDTAVRAAKMWVTAGQRIKTDDIPALLLGMAEAVADGDLQPSQASAIAHLIKLSIEMEDKIRSRKWAEIMSPF